MFTDIGETHVVSIENGVLHHHLGEARGDATATVRLTRAAWNRLATKQASAKSLVLDGELSVDGSVLALVGFFARLDAVEPSFEIVRP